MEDWKKSEGTFNLACDPQRASGMMQNTCVKIEHVTKRFGEDMVLQEVNLSLKCLWDCWKQRFRKDRPYEMHLWVSSCNYGHYFCIWKKNRP